MNQLTDKLGVAELEELILLRRSGGRQCLPSHRLRTGNSPVAPAPSRRRKRWEKLLHLLEVIAVLILLLLTGISARGWLALWQRLPLQGVTIVSEPVIEEPDKLPPIGWQSSLSANRPPPANAALQDRQIETPQTSPALASTRRFSSGLTRFTRAASAAGDPNRYSLDSSRRPGWRRHRLGGAQVQGWVPARHGLSGPAGQHGPGRPQRCLR